MPISWINHYLVDSLVCFVNTYPLDSDLSRSSIHLLKNWGLFCMGSYSWCAFLDLTIHLQSFNAPVDASIERKLLESASHYIFDIILQIGVAALIFPVIPHEDKVIKQTWSTSWRWYSLVVCYG